MPGTNNWLGCGMEPPIGPKALPNKFLKGLMPKKGTLNPGIILIPA